MLPCSVASIFGVTRRVARGKTRPDFDTRRISERVRYSSPTPAPPKRALSVTRTVPRFHVAWTTSKYVEPTVLLVGVARSECPHPAIARTAAQKVAFPIVVIIIGFGPAM